MKKLLMTLLASSVFVCANEMKQIDYLSTVKDIIISTQKIRGGTYNFLNGSEFAQFGVYEERSIQKNAFSELDRHYITGGKKLDAAFDKLRKQTKSLNKLSFELQPLVSFKAYSTLINKMIETNKAGRFAFFDKSSLLLKNSSMVMINDILPLSEGLGKLRGLGSGIIGRGYCEEEEVKMMKRYVYEIHYNLKHVIQGMESLQNANPKLYSKTLSATLTDLKNDINKYVVFAKNKLIAKEDIQENSNDYFDRGTKLISKVMKLYRVNEDIMKENIEKENFAPYNTLAS